MVQVNILKQFVPVEPRRKQRVGLPVPLTTIAACGFVLCAGMPQAHADVTDELLEIMKTKGDLTDAQYKTLKSRHQQEKAAAVAAAKQKAVSATVPVAIKK